MVAAEAAAIVDICRQLDGLPAYFDEEIANMRAGLARVRGRMRFVGSALAKTALGYAMGPMELLDLVGLDTQVLLCEALHSITHEPRAACPPLLRRMVAARRLGRKTQRGFLNYESSKIFGS